jgi:hypothetical protein
MLLLGRTGKPGFLPIVKFVADLMSIPFHLVDVFAAEPLTGNPVNCGYERAENRASVSTPGSIS